MADKISKSPVLIINELQIIGHRKNYPVYFHLGLNIIHGDSDTGKSSIIDLIDYCLGGYEVDLYNEITSAAKECLLEIVLNGKVFTIKRNIFENNALIEVYHSTIAEMNTVFPFKYSPNFSREGEDGFISDFFMDALSIPKVEIKQSPTKPDSKMVRLSFRDILKYNFLSQDDVGSKNLLDVRNPVVAVKNQETFKFLHNLLDEAITRLNALISEKSNLKQILTNKYNTVSAFLRETNLKSREDLVFEQHQLSNQATLLNNELQKLNDNMVSSTQNQNDLRQIIRDFNNVIKEKNILKANIEQEIKQNILLKNDYELDIEKLSTAIKVNSRLSVDKHRIDCPVCQNDLFIDRIKEYFPSTSNDFLESEIKSLKRRVKDVNHLIEENRNLIINTQVEIARLNDELEKANILLDNNTKETISPFISQRDGILTMQTRVLESIDYIQRTIKVRNQLEQIIKSVSKIELELEKLNEKLKELKASTPTPEQVCNKLADFLKDFLLSVQMNNVFGISVDQRTFLPKVRDIDYVKLTSGGVRTLVSIGYFISLLKNSLSSSTNHPNFLIIDTIGKYLGKTKQQYLEDTNVYDDKIEGFSADDPTKYLNIYKYLIKLTKDRDDVQIIVIDNDIPPVMASELKSSIVVEFNTMGTSGRPRGLIDDAYLH
ncbi:AAA family ATPase [Sphingobacterium mizutaii]|uniref:AAA family ATPase n=1 Tax=Sphingobacterium mizutaii TaxID=1010 RepID=UPI0016248D60|nr:hypothetical protein [Sphingobacterium mizutaii]